MSSLLKKFLSGIINTTSTGSEGKKTKMINLKTNVPEIDQENDMLFRAAILLEKCGNTPGTTANQFYAALLSEGITMENEDFIKLSTAAVAIETMMTLETTTDDLLDEPTIH
jgi:hypothetical protein